MHINTLCECELCGKLQTFSRTILEVNEYYTTNCAFNSHVTIKKKVLLSKLSLKK